MTTYQHRESPIRACKTQSEKVSVTDDERWFATSQAYQNDLTWDQA